MAIVTFMPAVSMPDIIDRIERAIDLTGYVRKEVTIPEPCRAIVTITFKDSEPRVFHLISKDLFASLDNVRVYEVKP